VYVAIAMIIQPDDDGPGDPEWLHDRTKRLYGRTMSDPGDVAAAQEALQRFVRNFGLHQPGRTPCGQPLPVSEAYAVAELFRESPLRQVDLGRRLRLEKSTVSRLVTNLVNRGWVGRTTAADDGRGVQLRLTDEGLAAARRLAAARQDKLAALLDRVPDDRRAALVAALQLLAEAADEDR
jgi:DNA-binding MarR family transcriptional regulator